MNKQLICIPVRTPNPTNGSRGQAFANRARAKAQRSIAADMIEKEKIESSVIKKILVRRVTPSRGLDEHDNLRSALKHVVDGIAEGLKISDDRKIKWEYDQRRGTPREYCVEVEVFLKS